MTKIKILFLVVGFAALCLPGSWALISIIPFGIALFIDNFFTETYWHINRIEKPPVGDEYIVVWDLKDGGNPVTTSMDWDPTYKTWTDPRNGDKMITDQEILFWTYLPKLPKF